MSNQGGNKNLGEVFKAVKQGITANKDFIEGTTALITLIGSLIAILIGFITWLLGNTGLVTSVLLVGGSVFLLGICVFVYFRQVTEQKGDTPTKRYAYPKRVRRLALVGLFTILILISLSYWRWSAYSSRQVIVLVANFQSQATQSPTLSDEHRLTEKIKYQLDAATQEFRDDVKIQRLGETITDKNVARAKGKQYKAKLVLWGLYDLRAKYFSIHFEVLGKPSSDESLDRDKELFDVTEPQYFAILFQQPDEMSYVTLVAIGIIRYEAQAYDDAIALFTKALNQATLAKEKVEPAVAYFYRGNAYYIYKHNYDLAINDYTQALNLKLEPHNIPAIYYNLGNAHTQLRQYQLAIENYKQAISLNLNFVEAYYNRGFAHAQQKQYEPAIADYTQVIKLKPNKQITADAYYNLGNIYNKQDQYKLAIENYKQAIALNSADADAYYNLGNAYANLGLYDPAIKNYTQALTIKRDFVDAYNSRGIVYIQMGEYNRAIRDYTKSLKYDPNYADAYKNRGTTYIYLEKYNRALADLNQAIALKPTDPDTFKNRGFVYEKQGKYNRAIIDYTQVLKLNPDDAEAYNNRGFTYAKQGDYDRALEDIDEALERRRDFDRAYDSRGFVYAAQGDYHRAIQDYNQALRLNCNLAGAYLQRGLAYRQIGEQEKAIADFRQVLELTKNSELSQQAEQQLQEIANNSPHLP